ncbi:MAG: hypothetical protein ACRBBP_09590 [Bdellovibrionales bacterium]
MNKYVKLATLATTAAVMGMSTVSLAEEAPEMERITINGGGNITLDQDGNVDAEVLTQLVFNLSESVKVEITSDLYEVYEGVMDDNFDLDTAIKEGKVSFDVVNVGPVERVVLAIKMDIDDINMSVLDPDGSLAGSGAEGVAAVRVHLKSSYLEGLVVTAAETSDNGLALDSSSVRVSARAAKSLGMVTIEGEIGYTFNDASDDVYAATAGITLDLSEQISGLEAFAQATAGSNGLEGYALGANYDFNDDWTFGVTYEDDKTTSQIRAGASTTLNNGHTVSGSVAMNTNTKAKSLEFKYEIPMGRLWGR